MKYKINVTIPFEVEMTRGDFIAPTERILESVLTIISDFTSISGGAKDFSYKLTSDKTRAPSIEFLDKDNTKL